MPRILVIRRKPRWMRALCHFPTSDLLQRVNALARGIEGVHEMHGIVRCVIEARSSLIGAVYQFSVSHKMSQIDAPRDSHE